MIKYDIVIIDSGVDFYEQEDGIAIVTKDFQFFQINDIIDEVGHGSAIYNIIKTHNHDAKCFHLKIYDKNNESISEDTLIYALNYIYDKIECRFVNMSLGVSIIQKREELYQACQRLNEKGIILISAFDNMEVVSYPAAFDNVIGVASDPTCSKISDYVYIDHPLANVCGKGGLQRVKWTTPKSIFAQGNSYACAHITGILSNYCLNNLDEALLFLKNNSKSKVFYKKSENNLDVPLFSKNNNAVLFPFNKEMHSLVRFSELLSVNLVDIYDVRESARVNASTNTLLRISSPNNYIIKNIEEIDWNTFDVFIVGHTEELITSLGKKDWFESLILKAIKYNKYVYCFDDISYLVSKDNFPKDRLFYPKTTIDSVAPIPLGMLYRPWVPMIGVFGTTSKQGKYTLQLYLREKFLRDGFSVGQIGTEPSAYLFNMDLCFHFGYKSSSNIFRQNMVSYLNSAINDISKKGVDIIISGCQSGTVTYDYGNINYYTFSQTEFLLSTLPDAVILCVNSFDEVDYIRRTIQYIESCVDTKIIALSVFPLGYNDQLGRSRLVPLSDEVLDKVATALYKQLGIPAFILGRESDMEELYAKTVSFFSSDSETKK